MRKPEQQLWDAARPLLLGLDPVRVENAATGEGTPDVNIVSGWVELKRVGAWPRRATTKLRVPHFRPKQRAWLARRAAADGQVWVLLQVAEEWLLVEGGWAARHLGRTTRAQLLTSPAVLHWDNKPSREELQSWLRS